MPRTAVVICVSILLVTVGFVTGLHAQNPVHIFPDNPAPDGPQVITDDAANTVRVLIKGKEVLSVDENGLIINGNLEYSGTATDNQGHPSNAQ